MPEALNDFWEWDESTVEITVGPHYRVILNTVHGQVILDVRTEDVNAFVLTPEGRRDFTLLGVAKYQQEAK